MNLLDKMKWSSDNEFQIDGTNFLASVEPEYYRTRESTEQNFYVAKTREMIEDELEICVDIDVKNMVDLGILQGGSVALFDSLFAPEKLVAIDCDENELPTLEYYIKDKKRLSNIRIYPGVDQSDRKTLSSILDREFGMQKIDLVNDDASHQYMETKASFDLLFPRLAENGIFLIEDWQWSTTGHHHDMNYFRGRKGLLNLVVQCIALCGRRPDIIQQVRAHGSVVAIIRGGAELSDEFDIGKLAMNKGEPIEPVY